MHADQRKKGYFCYMNAREGQTLSRKQEPAWDNLTQALDTMGKKDSCDRQLGLGKCCPMTLNRVESAQASITKKLRRGEERTLIKGVVGAARGKESDWSAIYLYGRICARREKSERFHQSPLLGRGKTGGKREKEKDGGELTIHFPEEVVLLA